MGPSLGLVRYCGEGAAERQGDLVPSVHHWAHLHRSFGLVKRPYYFPDVGTLLKALQRNVQEEGMTVSQPGPYGWNSRDLSQVKDLLRPRSYPHVLQ